MAAILTRLSELRIFGRFFLLFLCAGVCLSGYAGLSYAKNLPPIPPAGYNPYYQNQVQTNIYGSDSRYWRPGEPYDPARVTDSYLRDLYSGRSRGLPYAYSESDRRNSSGRSYGSQNSLMRSDRWTTSSNSKSGFYLKPETNITGNIPDRSVSSLYSSQRKPFSLNSSELESRLARQADRASKDVLRHDNTEFKNPLEERMNLSDSQALKQHVPALQETSDKDVAVNIKDFLSERSDQIQAEKMQKVLTPEGFKVWLEVQAEENKRKEKELGDSKIAEMEEEFINSEEIDPEESDADSKDPKEQNKSEDLAEITKKITYEQALAADQQYEDFITQVDAKFNKYLKLGQKRLKEGQYYDARDAFEMAGIWSEKNPAALAGKGFAHFAAGEYMSSTANLMWAIEPSDKFLEIKIDIAEIIGSAELFDKRVEELKTVYQTTGFHKSSFLLAYISYQNGEFEKAREYINTAKETLGQTDAFKSLKKAIDNGLKIDSRE